MDGFIQTLTSGKIAKLISLYTIVLIEGDLREPEGIPKFSKASNWTSSIIPEQLRETVYNIKSPNSGASP